METGKVKKQSDKVSKFKSYYVVWKPVNNSSHAVFTSLFKSYYVVWKLMWWKYVSASPTTFKSYYVVWKHLALYYVYPPHYRLNRTM